MDVTVRQKEEQGGFKLWKKKKKWLWEILGNCQTHSFYRRQSPSCENNDKWHPGCLFTAFYTKGICAANHKGCKHKPGSKKGSRLGCRGRPASRQSPEAKGFWGQLIRMTQGGLCPSSNQKRFISTPQRYTGVWKLHHTPKVSSERTRKCFWCGDPGTVLWTPQDKIRLYPANVLFPNWSWVSQGVSWDRSGGGRRGIGRAIHVW